MSNPAWTAEEDAKLRELTATYTTQEMAEAIGRSRKGVVRRMQRLGLKARWKRGRGGLKTKLWYPEDDRKLLGLTHLPQKVAAKRLNIRLVSLQKRVQSLGIKWCQGRQNPSALATLMGIDKGRVYRFVKNRGLDRSKTRGHGGCYLLSDDDVDRILKSFREGRLYLQRTR